jgi:hypothetical protein
MSARRAAYFKAAMGKGRLIDNYPSLSLCIFHGYSVRFYDNFYTFKKK